MTEVAPAGLDAVRAERPRARRTIRVSVVVPFTGLTGGTRVLVDYADGLRALGHHVTIVYPWYLTAPRGMVERLKGPAKSLVNGAARMAGTREIRWKHGPAPTLAVPALADRWLPDADVIVASENRNAEALSRVSAAKGARLYLVQGYETWTRPAAEVEATWQAPGWRLAAVSAWLRDVARERCRVEMDVLPNGVDTTAFHPSDRAQSTEIPRVLAVDHAHPGKGTADVVEAMLRARAAGARFRPVFFGTGRASPSVSRLADAEHHRFPTGERLRRLYASADVFVSASREEGFCLPPLEAMACGAAVVASRVGAVPEYASADTACVVEPGDVDAMAQAIIHLAGDAGERERMGRAAAERAREHSFDRALARLEGVLLEMADGGRAA